MESIIKKAVKDRVLEILDVLMSSSSDEGMKKCYHALKTYDFDLSKCKEACSVPKRVVDPSEDPPAYTAVFTHAGQTVGLGNKDGATATVVHPTVNPGNLATIELGTELMLKQLLLAPKKMPTKEAVKQVKKMKPSMVQSKGDGWSTVDIEFFDMEFLQRKRQPDLKESDEEDGQECDHCGQYHE